MLRKVLVPVVLLSLGVFSTTFSGCGSDSPKGSGTGGKGGASATGGKGGSAGSGVTGTGGSGTGGGDAATGGSAAGGSAGSVATGGAGGALPTGGAGGGTAGAAGGNSAQGGSAGNSAHGGAAGNSAHGGAAGHGNAGANGTAGAGGHAGAAAGGAGGGAIGGAGGGMSWPTTENTCPMPYPNVAVTDFCSHYTAVCGEKYGMPGFFASMADCVTKYTAYTSAQKACTAYHLCIAGTPNNAASHCPHPSGGTSNPCGV